MALTPFEKEIRDKLENREIQPGNKAWDRLDAMLAVTEEQTKPKKKKIGWWYVAASVVVLLFVGLFFMDNKKDNIGIQNEVVVNENNENVIDTTQETIKNATIDKMQIIPKNKNTETKIVVNKSQKPQNKIENLKSKSRNNFENQEVASQEAVAQQPKELPKEIDFTQQLDKAQTQAMTTFGNDKITVSAGSLLNAVESKPKPKVYDQGVFAKVQKNYVTVKTALANRNKE